MKKSDKMRKLMAEMAKEMPKKKKAKKKKAKKIDADVNKDGKVDEKDVSLVEKAASVMKKIVKKKD